ncbi:MULTISPECIES: hypothetical protein [Paenibacillus]|uniref:hypothetical protein n=1 Tax=Paenibacillus TaxID=44249 RepID=UPI000CF8D261|nr:MULTISPECIES: hypothetical protein [Paenibacillus]MBJ9992656.1 hypothetical protein [Paenibacillus sp. S28]MEC0177312.1 hypothetical protein [Paenibacillus favisporus]PQP90621.1 hypothetical protein CPT76_06655 [Paenibacillus sp. AR247]
MDKIVDRYYLLKQRQRETEQELKQLREEITAYCETQQADQLEIGAYKVKLVSQIRKEYDDQKLYEALPDPDLWRLMSKADGSKISSLVRLRVIPEERLENTYEVKQIKLLHVDKI